MAAVRKTTAWYQTVRWHRIEIPKHEQLDAEIWLLNSHEAKGWWDKFHLVYPTYAISDKQTARLFKIKFLYGFGK